MTWIQGLANNCIFCPAAAPESADTHLMREREEGEQAKAAKTDKRRFTCGELDVIWQSSIFVNKWWGQGTETGSRSKTLINYLYLLNETTLILVSRSGRKRADLLSSFNIVGISLITRGMESWFSLHRKPIVHPNHLSQPHSGCWTPALVGKLVHSVTTSLKEGMHTRTNKHTPLLSIHGLNHFLTCFLHTHAYLYTWRMLEVTDSSLRRICRTYSCHLSPVSISEWTRGF